MSPLNISIVSAGIPFVIGRIIWLWVRSKTTVVRIVVCPFHNTAFIWGKNKYGIVLVFKQVTGTKIIVMGKMLITIKNSQIVSIAKS